ncbi:MAG: hypothetical protein ACR2P5_04740 [Gammaproteobacteria bacterium]
MARDVNLINYAWGHTEPLFEWPSLTDADTDPAWISRPANKDVTIQLMDMTGAGTVIPEYSLNADADPVKVWSPGNDNSNTPVELTVVGQGSYVQENGVLFRVRISAGAGIVARVRVLLIYTRG